MENMKENNVEGLMQDVSQPIASDAVHHGALGKEKDYRNLAQMKALVDKYFSDVQNGKINPRMAIRGIKADTRAILAAYQ